MVRKGVEIKHDMDIVGGVQDEYAAAFWGINFLRFEKDKVIREQLNLDKKVLKNKILLFKKINTIT